MRSSADTVTISVELSPTQARALAQFCKRVGFTDCRSNAVSDDEAYQMIYALNDVREALALQGYAPR